MYPALLNLKSPTVGLAVLNFVFDVFEAPNFVVKTMKAFLASEEIQLQIEGSSISRRRQFIPGSSLRGGRDKDNEGTRKIRTYAASRESILHHMVGQKNVWFLK